MAIQVTRADVVQAQKKLSTVLKPSPLVPCESLSRLYGCEVFLKLETAQPIGSFKIRGATNKILNLSSQEISRGIIAASAGNHAQGVAWGARLVGAHAVIVMPENAPLTKITSTQSLGAEVVLKGSNYDEAFDHAQNLAVSTGRTLIHAFKDAHVIAGQGTVALEILDQCPDVDYVVTSIGGGGIAGGMGVVLKSHSRPVGLIACQAEGASAMIESIKARAQVDTRFTGSFADGISVRTAHPEMLKILQTGVDDAFVADDEEIAMNVVRLMERAKVVAEGSGAIVLGALDRYPEKFAGKKVVLVISGGNIDVNVLSRILEKGLVRAGRRLRLKIMLRDRPGALSDLTRVLGELRCNILQVIHDRTDLAIRIDETEVDLTLETRGPEHSLEVRDKLKGLGYLD